MSDDNGQGVSSPGPGEAGSTGEDGQRYESFVVRVLINDDGSIRDTRIEQIGTGEVKRWAGWEHEAMLGFIQDAVNQAASVAPAAAAAPAPVQAGEPRARLAAPGAALSLDRDVLPAAEPFTVTMTPDLTGAAVASDRLSYTAVVVARQLGGGPKLTLARAQGLLATAGTPAIRTECPGLAPGVYRLEGAVSLRAPTASHAEGLAAMTDGIMLQVMAG